MISINSIFIESVIIILSFFLLLGFLYFVYKKSDAKPFVIRRFSHIFAILLLVLFVYFFSEWSIVLSSLIFSFIFLIFIKSKLFDFLDRSSREVGIVTFPMAIFLSAVSFLFLDKILFVYAVLILGFSDGLSGFGGYLLKSKKSKTILGSTIFFLTSIIISTVILSFIFTDWFFIIWHAILLAAILTFIEFVVRGGWDNLFVPVSAGILLSVLI